MATNILPWQIVAFCLFSLITISAVLGGFVLDFKPLMALPAILILVYLGITNFRFLYFLLWFLLPLSNEFEVTESLMTDLPSEPLMMGFLLLMPFFILYHIKKIDVSFFLHPLIILLVVHFVWMIIPSIFSTTPLFSFKYLLAKAWYFASFVLASAVVIKSKKDVLTLFWVVFIPLTFTVLWTLIKHGLAGFTFESVNFVMYPFFRNHVNYAAMITVFLPFIFWARTQTEKHTFKRFLLTVSVFVYVLAIYLSYTRACYIATAGIFGAYFVFKFNLGKIAIPLSIVAFIIGIGYFVNNNKYIDYAPTTKTITHDEFGDHVSATFEGKDVSSMERVYRWIAGVHMIKDKPLVGFGPNSFYHNYKNYTIFIFETWVSENQEKSTIHNYFMLLAVEQGLPAMFIFIGLLIFFFFYAERKYHSLNANKGLIMACLLAMVALVINLMLSDLIETDKLGSLFFLSIVIVVMVSRNFSGLLKEN